MQKRVPNGLRILKIHLEDLNLRRQQESKMSAQIYLSNVYYDGKKTGTIWTMG